MQVAPFDTLRVLWYASYQAKASACTECEVCVERCPFDVDIMAKIREAVALFEA